MEVLNQPRQRRRTEQGERTHRMILQKAIDLASVEGLEGLSIGRLATALNMSKSGLFAHFGSKEDLQLATLRAARAIFSREVMEPAREETNALARLWLLCERWLTYMEDEIFRGGCFFISVSAEFDGRPGRVRDQIEAYMREWMGALEQAAAEAQQQGLVNDEVDGAQLAFEISALAMGANWAFQLFEESSACNRARRAILGRLRGLSSQANEILPEIATYLS